MLLAVAAAVLLCGSPRSWAQGDGLLRFTRAVVVEHSVGDLCWSSVPDAGSYELYRRFPGQDSFVLLASLTDTHYVDTLHRVVCADTVNYYVRVADTAQPLLSDTVGLFFQDDIPTAPCTLRFCTVDTLLNRVHLSWNPSPDTDVMGYYICMGSPCLDYDTVWGRLNNEYVCREDLTLDEYAQTEFSFRILAFDSCFQASPLTPYYHNPVLNLHVEPCSRHVHFSWNRYINMPDSIQSYHLHYTLNDDTSERCFYTGPDGPYTYDIDFPDLAVHRLRAYLVVYSNDVIIMALSRVHTFHFASVDTAEYVRIGEAEFDNTAPAVHLTMEVDPDFQGTDCRLMRAEGRLDDMGKLIWSPFATLAEVPREVVPAPQQFLEYTDREIRRSVSAYSYRLDVGDICGQLYVSSDTVVVQLPVVEEGNAWFPNVIKGGDPDVGRFCPAVVSPLADSYRLEIFSRMGERVFLSTELGECWEGNDMMGRALPQGVYVYRLHCHHADGAYKNYQGTVLLLR